MEITRIAEVLCIPEQIKQLLLSEELPKRQEEWAAIVEKYNLAAPSSIAEFVGDSAELTDFSMATGLTSPPPVVVVSTIKARQFGFHDCIDTEDMLRKWMKRYQDARNLENPERLFQICPGQENAVTFLLLFRF